MIKKRYFAYISIWITLVCCLLLSSCRYCSAFPEDSVEVPGESEHLNTISFRFYHKYYGEIHDLLDLLGIRHFRSDFSGLVVRSLRENQTLKQNICVNTRDISEIALQFSNGKVCIWSSQTEKWIHITALRNKSWEMYSLLMSISLVEAFNDDACLDQETNDLYCRVKKIVYSYYGINGDAYDNMLRSNRDTYRKYCGWPECRLRKQNNSYRIHIYRDAQGEFERCINHDYFKKNGVRLPHSKISSCWWDSDFTN